MNSNFKINLIKQDLEILKKQNEILSKKNENLLKNIENFKSYTNEIEQKNEILQIKYREIIKKNKKINDQKKEYKFDLKESETEKNILITKLNEINIDFSILKKNLKENEKIVENLQIENLEQKKLNIEIKMKKKNFEKKYKKKIEENLIKEVKSKKQINLLINKKEEKNNEKKIIYNLKQKIIEYKKIIEEKIIKEKNNEENKLLINKKNDLIKKKDLIIKKLILKKNEKKILFETLKKENKQNLLEINNLFIIISLIKNWEITINEFFKKYNYLDNNDFLKKNKNKKITLKKRIDSVFNCILKFLNNFIILNKKKEELLKLKNFEIKNLKNIFKEKMDLIQNELRNLENNKFQENLDKNKNKIIGNLLKKQIYLKDKILILKKTTFFKNYNQKKNYWKKLKNSFKFILLIKRVKIFSNKECNYINNFLIKKID